ncbi:MAG: hypothetical protein CM1200mP18_21050 [Gammaproteobacteria bacterium]|nr:MAG: hypothetical protein CM1200mP18_21050 [Gammaproteobacteria bacterium]
MINGKRCSRLNVVIGQICLVCHLPVVNQPPGHHGYDPASGIAVIGCHTRVRPDHLLMFFIDSLDIVVVRVTTHFQ